MELFDGVRIVAPYPALYIDRLDAVVISDLHLGLEELMADAGTYMPKVQLDEIRDDLDAILTETDPDQVIICGDLKHEFSETSYSEREEVQELIEFLRSRVDTIRLVQGNHDNYLIYPVEDYDSVELADYFVLDGICFMHGHEILENLDVQNADMVIMGHEHPALALEDDAGVTEKIDCFLYGAMDDGRDLVVLPAFSHLSDGTPVNRSTDRDLLSPVLQKQVDIDTLKAVGIDRDAGVLPFPALKNI